MAPAKSRKLSIAPINTSVKSNSEIRLKKLSVVAGKMLAPTNRISSDRKMAMSIMPIVEGNFRNRKLIYAKRDAKTIRTEKE